MPQHKSCEKRIRTNEKARLRNRQDRSRCRTMTKRVLEVTDKTEANNRLKEAYELFDHMTSKRLMHRNTAARRKAILARHVNSLSV
ncbi:30S ribosomal protein S20 [bacterium]|nr:30S ribosomal protein S20 [bacterium]